ncbi:MAG TPA: YkvA family protein [Chloroflexia bacterium]|nr:YkvA family protein [Chloroflexia bacterium]
MSEQKQPGALAEIWERGRLVWRLMSDQRVPTWVRVGIPALVLLYFISPIDLIPDFILGLGQLDDLGVILLGMSLFIRFAPDYVVDEHKRALGIDLDSAAGGEPTRKVHSDSAPIEGEYTIKAEGKEEQEATHNGYKQ